MSEKLVPLVFWLRIVGLIIGLGIFGAGVITLFASPAAGVGMIVLAAAVNVGTNALSAWSIGLVQEPLPVGRPDRGASLMAGSLPATEAATPVSPLHECPVVDEAEREYCAAHGFDPSTPESYWWIASARMSGAHGLSQDVLRGYRWHYAAAVNDVGRSCLTLAIAYLKGEFVDHDEDESNAWLVRGAELGDTASQRCLGTCYRHGDGFPHDMDKAIEWYERAAVQGCEIAMYVLGEMYESNSERSLDLGKALYWYRLAAAEGHEDALEKVTQLESLDDAIPV